MSGHNYLGRDSLGAAEARWDATRRNATAQTLPAPRTIPGTLSIRTRSKREGHCDILVIVVAFRMLQHCMCAYMRETCVQACV